MENHIFPRDFLWGAATASYQVEGAWRRMEKGNLFGTDSAIFPEKSIIRTQVIQPVIIIIFILRISNFLKN